MPPIPDKERRGHTSTARDLPGKIMQVWWWDCRFAACARPSGSQAVSVAWSGFRQSGATSSRPPALYTLTRVLRKGADALPLKGAQREPLGAYTWYYAKHITHSPWKDYHH